MDKYPTKKHTQNVICTLENIQATFQTTLFHVHEAQH